MLSKEVTEFAKKIPQLSEEEKQWLLQQLNLSNSMANVNEYHPQKTFNITPANQGSGYSDTAINHDQILANYLLGE
jgi:hypothetical protein